MPRGFTDDPEGLSAFIYLKWHSALRVGVDIDLIGDWAIENEYRIMLCHRAFVVIDGIVHDFTERPAILMRNPDELLAFRLRWM